MAHPRTPSGRSKTQGGFAMLSALLALVVLGLMTRAQFEAAALKSQVDAGITQADVTRQIMDAANEYTLQNYSTLQLQLPVTRGAVTLADGNAVGQSHSPTVANLVAMGYLPAGVTAQALYVNNGNYQIRLRREPAACVGAACNIAGLVYIDAPMRLNANTLNGAMINGFMTRMGGGGMLATEVGNGANLMGPSGVAVANPAGNTPGIVGGPIGFGAPGWGPFLTVGDIRDPNFQGNLTVQGNIETRSRVDVTNAADTCNLASIWTNAAGVGEFAARSAACVRRAFVTGDGTVGVASATGQTRALLDGNTGEIRALGADGVTLRAGFVYNALGQSEAMADNLRNSQAPGSANAAGITLDGRVYGRRGEFGSVVINNTAVQGAVCTVANELVWGTNNGSPVLMKCEGGQYVYADGTTIATEGSACARHGAIAQTNLGVQLLCENGQWIATVNRLGRLQLQASVRVYSGNSVAKPACTSPATSHLMLVPLHLDTTSGALSYFATDVGWNWTIQILDNDGIASASSSALAHTYCAF